ncbi:YbaB/EbfC family DNA-binding protein [Mycobacterium sp. IDR2000157661]|uniref:YbaB/EbfC family DNA-binding protein n=1 Tax=Mycobacterium sp. IDR2000157661 TaxID=2867005 RepID=UPI001EEF4355|nr:YbaB/EbfC family DNA-binding protein [Mycobacterium sp. IDR2000157661]ULE34770.1 YbaB/EbfC family DNA-binding protein [Mycobacterium sp. IDR2000157661]
MADTGPHDLDDERDDLTAALDFSAAEEPPGGSDLAAMEIFAPTHQDEPPPAGFTVTNPPGSVTVTASRDGRVERIDLSPRAAELTERDLAAEIVVVAGLAAQEAKAAQYTLVLEGMRERGHDDAATRDFLRRDLELPSPEEAQAERARVFSARYPGDHD